MMLDYLVKDNDINIVEEDLVFIKALIAGEPKRCRYAVFSAPTGAKHLYPHTSANQKSHFCLRLYAIIEMESMWTSMFPRLASIIFQISSVLL
jgi:hypothetical protein